MPKTLNSDAVQTALAEHGMTQKALAESVGLSPQAVTNWLQGKDFPRPPTLLKLATILKLSFNQLVKTEDGDRPLIAFRKKGSAKTTATHIAKAEGMGMLLRALVPFLPELKTLRTLITSPDMEYRRLESAAAETRAALGIGERAVLAYEHLIHEFENCGAILVPVLWGAKGNHENALHIRLRKEDVTFIFLNLDTRIEDFKFWMAHELAHVYTPALAGTNDGEDYADAFAGALLFPGARAESAYAEAIQAGSDDRTIDVLFAYAGQHGISLNTVYQQVKRVAKSAGRPMLTIPEKYIHAARNRNQGPLLSETLFDPMPPEPERYIAACEHVFHSNFFNALQRMVCETGTGPSYVQQILEISMRDAIALHKELRH